MILIKPINSFLLALVLFIGCFIFPAYFFQDLIPKKYNWVIIIGFFSSFLFSLVSLIKGIKQIRRKEKKNIFNIIAIVGSSLILLAFLFIGIFGLILSIKGFPG